MSLDDRALPPDRTATSDRVADLVARCILALEESGRDQADALLEAEPDLARAARAQLESLEKAGMLRDVDSAGGLPTQIGPYRILERLGRGGMGDVHLAEQREPVRRRVALKLIRAGMDTREVLARFAVERQALALLDHPNIAKIYDAGAAPDGRPFIAMEFVPGVPITSYCDERGLSTDERIALFAEVCDTVQHAHQRGILHRDLKPSNLLVLDRDGRPWPKVIDFGVAKSTQHRLALESLYTELGQVLGTPEYMSPEQAASRVDVDTRTDVYSLGVVLYELLTGRLPIDSDRLRGKGHAEMERILRDESPPTPSTRISTLGDESSAIAGQRRTDPGSLRRRLRGDLDWIAMRALEKDRNRRYAMPADLAADLRRHLAREPVSAGPPSTWYRFSRFASRHRAPVAAASAVLVALVAGLVVSLAFWREADAARMDEAAARVAAEAGFDAAIDAADQLLVEVGGERLRRFPGLADERRRLLESGLTFCRSLLGRGAGSPSRALRTAKIETRVAWFQLELNLPRDCLATLDALPDPADPDAVEWLELQLGVQNLRTLACESVSDSEGALAACRERLAVAERLAAGGVDPARAADRIAECRVDLVIALQHAGLEDESFRMRLDEACASAREAVARSGPPSSKLPGILRAFTILAMHCHRDGQIDQARQLLDEFEAASDSLLQGAPGDADVLEALWPALKTRASILRLMGDPTESEAVFRQLIELSEGLVARFPGYSKPLRELAAARNGLAGVLGTSYRFRDSLEEFQRAIAAQDEVLAALPESVSAKRSLARMLGGFAIITTDYRMFRADHPLDDALAAADRAFAILDDERGADAIPADGEVLDLLARTCFVRAKLAHLDGDVDAAIGGFRETVRLDEALRARHPERVQPKTTLGVSLRHLGRLLLGRGEAEEAREFLERAVALEDALREDGVSYPDSDGRTRETLLDCARAQAACDDSLAALGSVDRAIALGPDMQVIRRLAAGVFVEGAPRLTDAGQRGVFLDRALEEAAAAAEILERQNGPKDGATPSRDYLITAVSVRVQLAEVLRARGESDRALQELSNARDHARFVFEERGRPRDRARLVGVYDLLAAVHEDLEDADGLAALADERRRILEK